MSAAVDDNDTSSHSVNYAYEFMIIIRHIHHISFLNARNSHIDLLTHNGHQRWTMASKKT